MRHEDLQQRFDTVRLANLMLANLNITAAAEQDPLRLTMHPQLGGSSPSAAGSCNFYLLPSTFYLLTFTF